MTLAIMYESVARRLGLKCDPVSFSAHFLLRFTEEDGSDDHYYIDVFNNGDIIRRGTCPHSMGAMPSREPLPVATTQQVIFQYGVVHFDYSLFMLLFQNSN